MQPGGFQPSPIVARVVRVAAPSRAYDVAVGDGQVWGALDIRAAVPRAARAVVFVDAGIPEPQTERVRDELAASGLAAAVYARFIEPCEAIKTIPTVERILSAMVRERLDRGDVVVALGGGVLGDLVGFAAATYRRGIAWINVPSTLLAMVDASVGGKTGANLDPGSGGLRKNMVGAFWQPSLVVADISLLGSLDERHFRAGLAECLKHGMLAADFGDAALGAWTEGNLPRIIARDDAVLAELVARNVAVKARVVGADEREEAPDDEGGRALLNLGHTFGHAIETIAGLTPDGDPAHAPLHHGEAVALGLVAAGAASEALQLARPGLGERVRAVVRAAGLPERVSGLPTTAELVARMADDKKVAAGKLRLVLPLGDGRCRVVRDPAASAVEAGWAAIRRGAS